MLLLLLFSNFLHRVLYYYWLVRFLLFLLHFFSFYWFKPLIFYIFWFDHLLSFYFLSLCQIFVIFACNVVVFSFLFCFVSFNFTLWKKKGNGVLVCILRSSLSCIVHLYTDMILLFKSGSDQGQEGKENVVKKNVLRCQSLTEINSIVFVSIYIQTIQTAE